MQVGDLVVDVSDISVGDDGPIGVYISQAMNEPHTACIADRLPPGVTLTGFAVDPSGEITLNADLSQTLLSDPDQRGRRSYRKDDE